MPGGREAPPGRAAMPAGRLLVFVCLAAATLPTAAAAQIAPLPMEPIDGEVVGFARIADGEGGFDPGLFVPAFGQGLAALGDIDGNGVDDLVAGADGPSGRAPYGASSRATSSSRPIKQSAISTTVTRLPKRRYIWANSRPM